MAVNTMWRPLLSLIFFTAIFLNDNFYISGTTDSDDSLLIISVATQTTDGFKRFHRSAKVYKLNFKVLGMGKKWEGGDVKLYSGGGHKVNLLKEELEIHKDSKNRVIMFVDGYDVMLLSEAERILKRFYKSKSKILFSAEGFCWPNENLSEQYPKLDHGKRFLNSGGFMGYAPELYEMVTSAELNNSGDDQLFYTKIYLDQELRKKWSIKLDHKAEIFQNLNGAVGDVELRFKDDDAYLFNTAYNTNPLVIHGNGASKVVLNSLGNYLAKSWAPQDGCQICNEDKISLESLKGEQYPNVVMGLFLEKSTPFLEEFLQRIASLVFPKQNIDLYIHVNLKAEYHMEDVQLFLDSHQAEYRSVEVVLPERNVKEWHARNHGLELCNEKSCDYYFVVDSDVMLTNPNTLKILIEQNRPVISPMLVRPSKVWSNFWGALTPDGFYARSSDYIEIVNNNRRGLWNVPFVSGSYLVNGTLLKNKEDMPSYIYNLLDADMAFCYNLRDKGIFLFITNTEDFGHLLNSETFNILLKNPEMYQIYDNKQDWEARYIHENFTKNLDPNIPLSMPCPDVYWFPVVTKRFCQELIGMMENFGKWSDGSNSDQRLEGGYENVPTRDIHMNQVGYEQQWLYFLREYVRPVQERAYTGYYHDPPQAQMNFVVRYKPNEQPALRPHHDSSTYTINVALNEPGNDYEGGGCRFVRYNCSIVDSRIGWTIMHPGRLTHYHEGLPTISGTRYIMVSFVDP